MAVETKQVEYTKELDDAMVLVVELVKDIKAGKSAGELAGENLKNLMDAISGIDQVPVEAKEHLTVALQTVGYRSGELTAALIS